MQSVVDELLQHIRSERPLTDMSDWRETKVFPPVSADQIAAAEKRLGFALPELLREIYMRVGNGGFGPGYGFIGIERGATDDLGRTVEQIYERALHSQPRNLNQPWPQNLLPCCYYGCAIYFCVDCSSPRAPVHYFEPNLRGDGPFGAVLQLQCESLEACLRSWLHGAGK